MSEEHSFIVDDELRALVDPLSDTELAELRRSVREHGIREPLVVWDEEDILLDGHHRYELACQHDLDVEVERVSLPDRAAAREWMVRNQLGRRNMNKYQKSAMVLQLEPQLAQAARERMLRGTNPPQNSAEGGEGETRQQLAELAGVSHDTISRVKRICKEAGEATRSRLRRGEASIHRVYTELREAEGESNGDGQENQSVHFSSESGRYNTPFHIVEAVEETLGGIDLDPCSNSRTDPNVPAREVFVEEDDGLTQRWSGRVFVNPPYGNVLGNWVMKCVAEYEEGEVTEAILLVPSRTDTRWFDRLHPYPRCYIQGRLKFHGLENSAPFPSMVTYLGEQQERFARIWAEHGRIYPGAVR